MKKALKIIAIAIGGLVLLVLVLSLLAKNSLQNQVPTSRVSSNMPMLSSDFGGVSMMEKSGAGLSESSSPVAPIEVDKKIIKTGNLNMKVDKVDKALEEIKTIAEKNKGEVFSSNIYQSSSTKAKSGTVVVKIPVDNFETAFDDLKKVASLVVSESTSGKDVTEQYADLQAQLKNKQAEEQSIAKILNRAGTIPEVLSVTKELSRARGEIEVLQGRIKLMESQTEMSTISLNISEDIAVVLTSSWRPWQIIKNAVNSLIDSIQGFINFLIRLIIVVIPVILLYGLLLWVIYRIGRRIYRKIRGMRTPMQQ